jgi:hypothetical protein
MAHPSRSKLLSLPLMLVLALGSTACDASFEDLRPPETGAVDLGPSDGSFDQPVADAGVADQRAPTDVGPRPDGFVAPDGSSVDTAAPADAGPTAGPIASGSFIGVSGYSASGTATVERLANGSFRLAFSSNFTVSAAPGMVVVMSDRKQLGKIDSGAGDVRLGVLKSQNGAQSYDLSAAAAQRTFVQIFCEPFAVDIGHAELKSVP